MIFLISLQFKSLVLCNEIDLNVIAEHFGITKKFKWEDPLILSDEKLNGILKETENKSIYIYHFGSLVFINLEYHELKDFTKYLRTIDPALKNNYADEFLDQYHLEIDSQHEYALYNEIMTAPELMPFYIDILSLVLAKSISLRKIETDIDKLLDSIEDVINYLDTGKFNMSDAQIAKMSAKVLRFKYNTISYLMLLDRPRDAWNNADIENFFLQVASLFEINDRYERINHKTQVLQDITDVFTSLSHEKRSNKLEIMVIVLILFELIISIIEFFFKFR